MSQSKQRWYAFRAYDRQGKCLFRGVWDSQRELQDGLHWYGYGHPDVVKLMVTELTPVSWRSHKCDHSASAHRSWQVRRMLRNGPTHGEETR